MMNETKTADQQKADAFLEEFVGQLGGAFGSEIDFILLFGSAARGEFILGKSDVDLVIQMKIDAAARDLELFAEPLFWQLDQKYGMRFKRGVSTGVGGSLLEDLLKQLEKHEGKILFGRDIRPEINPNFTWWEKLKAILVPQSIAFASVILAALLPQKAVSYAVKALFYEVESVNIFQKNLIPAGQEKLASFASATKFQEKSLDDVRFFLDRKLGLLSEQKMQFVKEAALVKREGFNGDRWDALQFCRRAFWIIWSTNAGVIIKSGGNL